LDFGLHDQPCPLNQPIHDDLALKNGGTKKIKVKFEPVCPANCTIAFSPESFSLDKGKSKKVKVKFVMLAKTNVNFKVTIRIDGTAFSILFSWLT
jgi:hypothetical protein